MIPLPVTLPEFKKHLNRPNPDAAGPDDDELELHLEAASEAIEARVGPLVTREVTERVDGTAGRVTLGNTPVREILSLSLLTGTVETPVDGFDATTIDLDGDAGIVTLRAVGRGRVGVVTYSAGRGEIDDIPRRFKLAVMITAAHLYELQRGRGQTPQRFGVQDDDSLPEYMRGFALPRRALELIGHGDEQLAFA
jgi:uncharacterized phiE125 gp8 family phage protein